MDSSPPLQWQPLDLLAPRFDANLAALQTRDADLAERLRQLALSRPFFIAARGDQVFLGRSGPAGIAPVVDTVPPASAQSLARRVFPNAQVTGPLAVCGIGHGWLWDRLSKLPCKTDLLPGHRPPIYFLAGDIEQLWAVLHVMDWREMLSERRHPIFAGPDAIHQFRQSLIADPTSPEPRGLIRIDSSLPALDLDEFLAALRQSRDEQLGALHRALHASYSHPRGNDWASKFRSGRLRVLGITSRYTTFLQHSMLDWLAAFDRLGHETRLVIEEQDHLMLGAYGYARAIHEFNPDLILIIDHYRAEIGNIPKSIPCVMWVQDRLPNIYCAAGGVAQGPRDYCIGFSRHQLSTQFGYPAERFLSCTIGVNEHRFKHSPLTPSDRERFGCDVSYVSHASMPADEVVREQVKRSGSRELGRLYDDMYQRLEAWYASGGIALTDVGLRRMLTQSMAQTGVCLPPAKVAESVDFFNYSVQNALYRHQTLLWLADMKVNLHLWGKGWERHAKLGRFARGVADNVTELRKIYLASTINIQVTPHGAVHQRLLDGLGAGGFFLLRWHPGDVVGLLYRELLDWCTARQVRSDKELQERADDRVQQIIARINELETSTPFDRRMSIFEVMNGHADTGFAGTADTLWPEYHRVAFASQEELDSKVHYFLHAEQERREIAASMRQAMVEKCSYTSISRRLLSMICDDLNAGRQTCAA